MVICERCGKALLRGADKCQWDERILCRACHDDAVSEFLAAGRIPPRSAREVHEGTGPQRTDQSRYTSGKKWDDMTEAEKVAAFLSVAAAHPKGVGRPQLGNPSTTEAATRDPRHAGGQGDGGPWAAHYSSSWEAQNRRWPHPWALALALIAFVAALPLLLLTPHIPEKEQQPSATVKPPTWSWPAQQPAPSSPLWSPPSPGSANGPAWSDRPPPAAAPVYVVERTVEALYRAASPAVVTVSAGEVIGSGFFVSSDGLLVTNYHVIANARYVSVSLSNGIQLSASVVASDTDHDLALLRVGGTGFAFLGLESGGRPTIGTKVCAIGSPQGFANSISEGIVSNLYTGFIQTTAAISPGSSGGPLLTLDGRVVGVTTLTVRTGQNLNLAVPAFRAAVLLDLHQKMRRTW